ncbi:hypothetical protein [Paenibacillus odorifer]|uniref:hypothetical protein n=1 Tax=Paenibacillus odorifer TaxID=189426 RepID=UPI0015C3761C|nr:hypothetical protein [Paenibacillus odorifer]
MELKRKVMDFTVPYDYIPRVAFSDIGLSGWMVGGGRLYGRTVGGWTVAVVR